MAGQEVTLTRVIQASPVRVWAVLTDIDNAPEVLSGVSKVERMTDGPYAVGTRWRETRTMMGKTVTEEMWVTENDPLRRTVIEAESNGTTFRSEFQLTPEGDDATVLRYAFAGTTAERTGVKKLLWKVVEALGARAGRKAMEQDLSDIATAAERMDGAGG